MKRVLKRNQFILTAMAIMLAIVGYLNFTKEDNGDSKGVIEEIDENMLLEENNAIKDTIDEESTDSTANEKNIASSEGEAQNDSEKAKENEGKEPIDKDNESEGKESLKKENETDIDKDIDNAVNTSADAKENVGEVVMVDNIISVDAIFDAKLTREQQRAKNKSELLGIVDDKASTQDMKDKALNEIISITAISEKELAAESLLEAKGYNNSIVSVANNGADVVIDVDEITNEDATVIMDVVNRKTGIDKTNIVISPVTSSVQEPQ